MNKTDYQTFASSLSTLEPLIARVNDRIKQALPNCQISGLVITNTTTGGYIQLQWLPDSSEYMITTS